MATKKKTTKSGCILVVGASVVIRAIPFHYVGRVAALTATSVILDKAAWLADSGRWSDFLATGSANEVEPYPDRVEVMLSSIADVAPFAHSLPLARK